MWVFLVGKGLPSVFSVMRSRVFARKNLELLCKFLETNKTHFKVFHCHRQGISMKGTISEMCIEESEHEEMFYITFFLSKKKGGGFVLFLLKPAPREIIT